MSSKTPIELKYLHSQVPQLLSLFSFKMHRKAVAKISTLFLLNVLSIYSTLKDSLFLSFIVILAIQKKERVPVHRLGFIYSRFQKKIFNFSETRFMKINISQNVITRLLLQGRDSAANSYIEHISAYTSMLVYTTLGTLVPR